MYNDRMENIAEIEIRPIRALEEAGIGYVRLTHPAADTMEKCVGIGAGLNARHCKNLFLTNRSGNRFCLLLMDADKPYRTSDVSKKLGLPRLSFASAEQLFEVMGLTQGSVTILGLVNDCAKRYYAEGKLKIAVDSELLTREKLCVHPNINTASLVISSKDLIRFLEYYGFEYTVTDV